MSNVTDDDELNVVPLLMQNKPPVDDDSTDNGLADLELRPDEVNLGQGCNKQ